MGEHVCEELIGLEVGCKDEVQAENAVEVGTNHLHQVSGNKHHYVYDEQVACYCWNVVHIYVCSNCLLTGGKITKNPRKQT